MNSEESLPPEDRYADLIPDWLDAIKLMASQSEAFDSLNHGEGHALLVLLKTGSGLSAGEMSEAMGLTTGRTANILRRLEDKGLIERGVVPSNRRKASIALTAEGRARAVELSNHFRRRAAEALDALGREDAEAFMRIVRKLAAHKGLPPTRRTPPA